MRWLDPRQEPVAYLMAFIAAVNGYLSWKNGGVDLVTALQTAGLAILAYITRKAVTPNPKFPNREPVPDSEEEVSQDPDFWDDENDNS